MAPAKPLPRSVSVLTIKNGINTRSRAVTKDSLVPNKELRSKRKADSSPTKENGVKRSALGDLTNAIFKKTEDNGKIKAVLKSSNNINKQVLSKKVPLPSKNNVAAKIGIFTAKQENVENAAVVPQIFKTEKTETGKTTRARLQAKSTIPNQTAQKVKETVKEIKNKEAVAQGKVKTRLSNEFEKTEESLYSSANEESSNDSIYKTAEGPKCKSEDSTNSTLVSTKKDAEHDPSNMTLMAVQMEEKLHLGNHQVPEGVSDFDKENWDDVYQASHYAMDIFNYLREREDKIQIPDYMDRQICLTKWMRSLLVDWMVEIQESFELNHETLYLGVKLVDLYLSRMTVSKETLQLVGAASMFVAAKYDERIPPQIEDFLYICDGAYSQRELIRMEMNLLKVCDFELGISISYRFLRRYARCAKITMPVLTLARFILEHSLMEYDTVSIKDSKLAAASLFLALRMKQVSSWTATLEFYTGYKLDDIFSTVKLLNADLHKKPRSQLMTVRNKYSHKIFFEVAKTPLVDDRDLLLMS